eukprot:2299701-Prymnesium_polylepis.1
MSSSPCPRPSPCKSRRVNRPAAADCAAASCARGRWRSYSRRGCCPARRACAWPSPASRPHRARATRSRAWRSRWAWG